MNNIKFNHVKENSKIDAFLKVREIALKDFKIGKWSIVINYAFVIISLTSLGLITTAYINKNETKKNVSKFNEVAVLVNYSVAAKDTFFLYDKIEELKLISTSLFSTFDRLSLMSLTQPMTLHSFNNAVNVYNNFWSTKMHNEYHIHINNYIEYLNKVKPDDYSLPLNFLSNLKNTSFIHADANAQNPWFIMLYTSWSVFIINFIMAIIKHTIVRKKRIKHIKNYELRTGIKITNEL